VPPEVACSSRGYTDAQPLNYYAADTLLDAKTFQLIAQESHQPVVISEYSFHALDGRSGNRNRVRFPGEVPTQEARAAGYRLMTSRLAQVPYIIGADWFQWMDEPPGGRRGDGEDVNFGIVDIHDRPYEPLVTAVKETAPLLNTLHAGSASSRNQLVWRTPPAGPHPPTAFAGGRDVVAK
jgi:agarase